MEGTDGSQEADPPGLWYRTDRELTTSVLWKVADVDARMEHLELIEKWKSRDLVEESKKSSYGESSGAGSAKGGGKKGRAKDSSGESESRIKAWIASTFRNSLKKIADKLEDVDRKASVALDVKGKKNIKEEQCHDGGSSEKRKREFDSPLIAKSRSKSRSKSAGGEVKIRPLRINISDEEDIRGNMEVHHETVGNAAEDTKLDEIKDMLQALMKGIGANSAVKKSDTIEAATVVQNVDKVSIDEEDRREKGKGMDPQNEVVEYMRCRLDYYMTKNYKEIKARCKSRDVRCYRKDRGVWELAKQDTDQFTKLVNNTENEAEVEEALDDDEENTAEGEDSEDDEEGNVSGN
ncbi:hypothetical protein CBR_g3551 [Chara braunii]|uniref:Uncharacterized protein n=1 Tax=Chara braunii TaxID=69332 RepID=A0A388KFT0_CHABU|nr:hypothetical protein CBR_g3551 [Chara braunii]|eukprot:GBG68857.1 hypothetical protein CBR_g3551 [Chara braunii]